MSKPFVGNKGQPAHKNVDKSHKLSNTFDNSNQGIIGAKFVHVPQKQISKKMHPCAHPETHHATYGGQKGFLGEHKLANSHKISKKPMGAFKYKDVLGD